MVELPKNLNATKINLTGLGLKEIPLEIFSYKNLRKLTLKNNNINKIPKEISELKLLVTLDLSNNNLSSLQANLFRLKKLEILIINNNIIKSIPKQIQNLKRLRILGIANNKLTDLDLNISSLGELKELNISGNNFSELPLPILILRNLEKLWIKQIGNEKLTYDALIKKLPHISKIYALSSTNSAKNTFIKENLQTIVKVGENINSIKKKIFISYSHKDIKWLEKVNIHLKALRRFGDSDFEVWDDQKILTGQKWKAEVEKSLKECTSAILLISSSFLASDFIYNEELQPLLEKAQNNGTLIIQLIINPCGYKRIKSLNVFQTVNDPEKEILTNLSEHDQDLIIERLVDDVERHIKNK